MDWLIAIFRFFFGGSKKSTPTPETPAPTISATRTLRRGSFGDDVRELQKLLGVKVDGFFGPVTEAAVKKYQSSNGLKADGIVGPITHAKLAGALKPEPPTLPVPGTDIYAPLSWEKSDPSRKAWSDYLHARLDEIYDSFVLKIQDIKRFRPDWDVLNRGQRVNVVAEIICATAKFESGWNPRSSSVDVGVEGKRDTYSIGLMQVSVVDQDWAKPRDKARYTYDELLTAIPNLDLTLAIMMRQVSKTGILVLPNSSTYRYWAVLLDGNKHSKVDQIVAAAKSFIPAGPASQRPSENPIEVLSTPEWMDEADKYIGKSEHDSKWSAFLGAYWPSITKLTGMGNSILGNWRAWCALFFGFVLSLKGYDFYRSGLAAEMGANTGKTIEYKINGAPRGAGIWKQTNGQNHICFLSGNCTAEDLTCKDCTFNCTGGNQGDEVSKATYKVADIKRVFWPTKKDGTGEPFPGKVTKSINCMTGKTSNQSTR